MKVNQSSLFRNMQICECTTQGNIEYAFTVVSRKQKICFICTFCISKDIVSFLHQNNFVCFNESVKILFIWAYRVMYDVGYTCIDM